MSPYELALHTWTLDTTPLADALRIAKRTGWNAVELRRIDFDRAREAGHPAERVLDLVQASGLGVAAVGAEQGWMFAAGADRERLLAVFGESCRWAAALGCTTVMSPVDRGGGPLEFNSQAEQLNALDRVREALALAGHPHCGLLLDTYHLQRSGAEPRALADLAPAEIAYVQYSDVPRSGLQPGMTLDRLPPGRGSVPFREVFRLLAATGYRGYLSYEAPNPAAWARDPEEVAREAFDATRALLTAA